MKKPIFLDAFCGAGGASTGIMQAGCDVAVAINHDAYAIAAHTSNHPEVKHLNDDIRKVNPQGIGHVDAIWWSAECTHLSNAKGGGSRDADSRMLSEELIRYVRTIQPRWVFVENVKEFLSWCAVVPKPKPQAQRNELLEIRYIAAQNKLMEAVALGRDQDASRLRSELDSMNAAFIESQAYETTGNKLLMVPDPHTKGSMYLTWKRHMAAMGYRYESRLLNAADYGAHQRRIRYFAIFTNTNHPIQWPVATHHETGRNGLPKWKPCRDILDMEDMGDSIFTGRHGKKALEANTLKRILHGLKKHGQQPFIDRKATGSTPSSINQPMPTVKAMWHYNLVNATMIDAGGFRATPTTTAQPLRTVMASREQALINACIINPHYTVTAIPKTHLAHAFLIKYYGADQASHTIDKPMGTVTTRDRFAKVQFIQQHHGGAPRTTPTTKPFNTIGVYQSQSLINAEVMPWDIPMVLQPAPKPTAKGNVIIPSWTRIENGYLVSNNILDIFYRGLKPSELKLAQGFPAGYKLDPKSMTRQKKQIGNAVHVKCAQVLVAANCGPTSTYYNSIQ